MTLLPEQWTLHLLGKWRTVCVWHGMAQSDIPSAWIKKSQTVMGSHRPWHKVVDPWANAFNISFFMQNKTRLGTVRGKTAGKGLAGTRERETKLRRIESGVEKSLGLQERADNVKTENKYVKPIRRIWKWEIINQTFDISGIWPLLNWSPISKYGTALCSITVREEITKPLNNYFSYRFVSFVSLLLLSSRGTYSSCQYDTCSFVT